MEEQEILFKRLKDIKDGWVKGSVDGLKKNDSLIWSEKKDAYDILSNIINNEVTYNAYQDVLNEIIEGVLHSILVMLDGGDELTDKFNIDIINADTKKSLKEDIALNEEFIGYLLDVEEE